MNKATNGCPGVRGTRSPHGCLEEDGIDRVGLSIETTRQIVSIRREDPIERVAHRFKLLVIAEESVRVRLHRRAEMQDNRVRERLAVIAAHRQMGRDGWEQVLRIISTNPSAVS